MKKWWLWGLVWSASVCAQTVQTDVIDHEQRLSEWLRQHPQAEQQQALSLSWRTPAQREAQQRAWEQLRLRIEKAHSQGDLSSEQFQSLTRLLQALHITGRVHTAAANSAWLEANPRRDPLLQAGDTVVQSLQPQGVQVINDRAQVCQLPHTPLAHAGDYVSACAQTAPAWVWVIQPDGHIQRVGTQLWNAQRATQIAPGARIWAPRKEWLSQDIHLAIAQQLSAQDDNDFTQLPHEQQPGVTPADSGWLDWQGHYLQSHPSSSDWGNTGLLQMPTARMREAGYFGVQMGRVAPYTQVNVFAQPTQDIEMGFRYVAVTNRLYSDNPAFSGNSAYLDKSLDVKWRLWHESTWLPDVAVGLRDLAGTGLFSSEYMVASKRTGRFDWTAGLDWGYMAQRGTFSNPLSHFLGHAYDVRTNDVGQGGQLATNAWFHGRAAAFAGVEYETPWQASIKVEYDSNNYQNEPLSNVFVVNSPINVGVVFHRSKWVDTHVSYERGNTLAFGVTLYTDFAGPSFPKNSDPPLPALSNQRPTQSPDWQQTAQDIQAQTRWRVTQIEQHDDTLVLTAQDSVNANPQQRLDRALAILQRDAPAPIEHFEVVHQTADVDLAAQSVDRQPWVQSQTQPARINDVDGVVAPTYPATQTANKDTAHTVLYQPPLFQPKFKPGIDLIQSFGGPDAFDLYQFSAYEQMHVALGQGLQLNGLARMRLLSNYQDFKNDGYSSLPRVRTYIKEYLTTNRATLTNLTLSDTQRVSQNLYATAYAGYFEEMFGGAGGEVLYRPASSRWAVGADFNRVRQRGFGQDLSWLNPAYTVDTGHVTTYWQTPVDGVTASVAVGQYLAGDRGATLTLTKTFQNGSVLGLFATKTNVPAAVFGEGSFDKGIFWSLPFDRITTSTTNGNIAMMWHPLTRDGGAMLVRPVRLYESTAWLGPDAAYFRPGRADNDDVQPDDRLEYHVIQHEDL